MPDEVCSPKPWRLECTEFAVRVVDANGDRVATVALGEVDPSHEDWDENVANAEHMVRCVNAFDRLIGALEEVQMCEMFHALPSDVVEIVNTAVDDALAGPSESPRGWESV